MTGAIAPLGIAVAALGGAAIGVERQRSGHASGPHARFGGVRTFSLLGAIAGLAGWLAAMGLVALAAVLATGAVALIVSGYVAASRRDVDGTSEAAALVVVGAGIAAGLGWLALASGIVAVTVLLLVEKSEVHALVERVDDEELRAAARFGVMAIVVLPLLPEGPIGPFGGIRPRELWLLVLLFTGLSFAGYLLRRMVGPEHGYPVAGLLGGLISSTNVTLTFARLSRRERQLGHPLAVGAVAACTMLFPRVMIAACVLNVGVARLLLPYLAPPFIVGVAALALWWRQPVAVAGRHDRPGNPLQVVPALQMAAVFQIVLFGVAGTRRAFGDSGVRIAGAVLGLTDVDALTVSMTTGAIASSAPATAATAIAIGILANCVMKAALTVAFGTPSFRRINGVVLTGMAAAIAAALAVMR
jgi:uncharacterized membrane protein (DUF4010 family)